MKKLIAVLTVLGVLALTPATSMAGDREWATAGKVLAGVVGVSMIAGAASHGYHHNYYQRPYHYYHGPSYHSYHHRPYYRPYYHTSYSHSYGHHNPGYYYEEHYY